MNTQSIEIYTDGSCHTQQRSGAWAAIIHAGSNAIALNGEEKNTTHNRMELVAVIKAIEFIEAEKYKGNITIYTDSQYVCGIPGRMKNFSGTNYLTKRGTPIQNTDLVKILIRQIETHRPRFVKVKAHQKSAVKASVFNHKVDMLTRKLVRKRVNEKSG